MCPEVRASLGVVTFLWSQVRASSGLGLGLGLGLVNLMKIEGENYVTQRDAICELSD